MSNNLTTMIESWFIPTDILMLICSLLSVIFSIIFLLIILFDKTCHTIPMMLIANSCLSAFLFGSNMFGMALFTLQNDLKEINFQGSICIFRGYISCVLCALLNFSFLIQAIYRYVIVVYPNRLFFQTIRFQLLIICLISIFCFVHPFAYIFNNEIVYNVDNQVCQARLRLSFAIIYMASCVYIIPVLLIMFIYYKLVRYVKEMNKHVTTSNTLIRAKRELKMVRRTVLLVTILFIVCLPYTIFIFMSFFNRAPKYHFRFAFTFIDVSLLSIMITLYNFTDPLKMSVMKRLKRRPNVIVATVA